MRTEWRVANVSTILSDFCFRSTAGNLMSCAIVVQATIVAVIVMDNNFFIIRVVTYYRLKKKTSLFAKSFCSAYGTPIIVGDFPFIMWLLDKGELRLPRFCPV